MLDVPSADEVLTFDPRFTGSPQGLSTVSRVVTHMSQLPYPPALLDEKYNERPSDEIFGTASLDELLTVDPRLMGVPNL